MFGGNKIKTYKENIPLNERKDESERIKNKYPDRVPCIVELSSSIKDITLDKNKYLVPNDLTCGQLLYIIRKRIKMGPEKALFMYVSEKNLPPSSSLLSQVYSDFSDQDGFLYLRVEHENTFGTCWNNLNV
jgi:GABA(A) receptor-associated protein